MPDEKDDNHLGARLVTEHSELPTLTRTLERTLYKGHLPVIIFPAEVRLEYEKHRWNWSGWKAARQLARAHFESHPECTQIQILFMNPPEARTEAAYGGRYDRAEFEPGGSHFARSSNPESGLHPAYLQEAKRTSIPFRVRAPHERQPKVDHPYKTMPPLSELKVATISFIEIQQLEGLSPVKDESVQQGMYILVPPHFPERCVILQTVLGYSARMVDGLIEEQFKVYPAATVSEAKERYQRMAEGGKVPTMLIGSRITHITLPSFANQRSRTISEGAPHTNRPETESEEGIKHATRIGRKEGAVTLLISQAYEDLTGTPAGSGEPYLLEGAHGMDKTALTETVAEASNRPLFNLQKTEETRIEDVLYYHEEE